MINLTDEETRVLAMSGHILLRMLRAREKSVLDRIYGELRSGRTDFLALITEYATIRDQIRDIETVLNSQT